MDLTIEDVKSLTFELFMAQRLIARLQDRLAELESAPPAEDHGRSHPHD